MMTSSSASIDDLYGIHNKTAIAEREKAQAELEKARAEAEQAQWEALIAKANASAAKDSYYGSSSSGRTDNPYRSILADDYESAYARRLYGTQSLSYRMPSSYDNVRYGSAYTYVSAYDPAFYNVMVSGDQVWVEPKYITSMFGSWGADRVNVNIYFGWNYPYGYYNNWWWSGYRPYYWNDWYWGGYWGDPYWNYHYGWGWYPPYRPPYWNGGHHHHHPGAPSYRPNRNPGIVHRTPAMVSPSQRGDRFAGGSVTNRGGSRISSSGVYTRPSGGGTVSRPSGTRTQGATSVSKGRNGSSSTYRNNNSTYRNNNNSSSSYRNNGSYSSGSRGGYSSGGGSYGGGSHSSGSGGNSRGR